MTSRDWKPGDVAMVLPRGGDSLVGIKTFDGWHLGPIELADRNVEAAWPLVVIDPEDREQVERLVRACPDDWCFEQDEATVIDCTESMQDALRSLKEPPKPEEPTGLGAVVEDAAGQRWTRVDGYYCHWSDGREFKSWGNVNAVRVLSEGVQP